MAMTNIFKFLLTNYKKVLLFKKIEILKKVAATKKIS